MDLDVVFLGTAASAPTARRGLPATLIRRGGEKLLVDCGEGTQRQLVRSVGLVEIDEVFLTHFHADHVLGIPGLLKTYGLQARSAPLQICGPQGLGRLFDVLGPVIGRLPFELNLVELDEGEELGRDGYRVVPFAADHGVRALGYALIEDDRPGRFDESRARELGVTPGPDFGRLQRGETVDGVRPEQVVGRDRAGRRIVVSGDTSPAQTVEVYAHAAEVLVHEATFCDDEKARARETGHSTARQAAELARDAGVHLLALTHLSTRYFARDVRDEARAVFANTVVPRDFDAIEVPFPERGEPHLVKAELEPAT
jgi:ribonuclease Z